MPGGYEGGGAAPAVGGAPGKGKGKGICDMKLGSKELHIFCFSLCLFILSFI